MMLLPCCLCGNENVECSHGYVFGQDKPLPICHNRCTTIGCPANVEDDTLHRSHLPSIAINEVWGEIFALMCANWNGKDRPMPHRVVHVEIEFFHEQKTDSDAILRRHLEAMLAGMDRETGVEHPHYHVVSRAPRTAPSEPEACMMRDMLNPANFKILDSLTTKELEVLAEQLQAALKRVQDELESRYNRFPDNHEAPP